MGINRQKFIAWLLFIVILSTSTQAQTAINNEKCKTGILHNQLMQSDPQYALRIQANEARVQEIINSGGNRTAGIYTIPVVVHVLHLGEAVGTGTNISNAQINSAIANMNACYSGSGSYPLDIGVQFQLAQRTPACGSTTGIVRINASATSDYATNGITSANEETIKALSKWPNSEYYNIWIVSEIEGNNGGSGTQGYAYYPGAGSNVDGAVILYNSFGYDPTNTLGYTLKSYTNYNVTANHEIGHAFNLKHTFEGDDGNGDGTADQCPANTTCASQGDLCCDTEAHRRDDGDCGATGTTCTGQSIVNIVQNIMSYSSDACQVKFTADQKARIRAAIEGSRASLLTSSALTSISGSAPSASVTCTPQTINLADDFGFGIFSFGIENTTYNSNGSVDENGYRSSWCSNFSLNANTLYTVQVTNGPVNNEKVKVYIDYNNDGDFVDAGENVYSDNVGALTHSGSFTTSATPVIGQPLWVRVISDFSNFTISGPCYVPQYGQVEDYSVVFSAAGCTAPTVSTSPVSPGCNGGSDGAATANVSGGTSPYTYLWNSGATTQTISNLAAGTYTVTVTDDVGCSRTKTAVVANPAAISLTTVIQNPSCLTNDGNINLSVSGGTAGYTYSWSNGSVTQDISSLTQGSYTVTVIDANGCTAQKVTSIIKVCVANTQVASSQCGQTLSDLSGYFYCNAVTGAQDYQWEFTNVGLSFTSTKLRGANLASIARTSITGLQYGVTYNVRVRVKVGGLWGNYSTTCAITIAPSATQVASSQCGQTVSDLSGYFYCNAVAGAQDYQWEFTNVGLAFTATALRGANLASIARTSITGLRYGTTYNVRVRAKAGNAWGSYSTTCAITIAPSATQVASSQCGQTVSDLSGYFYCNAVAGAQDYQWEFTNVGLAFTATALRGANLASIARTSIAGLRYGTTYNVRVRAKVGNAWGNYSTTCTITIAPSATQVASSQCNLSTNLSGYFICNAVAGAQDYQWEFTNSATSYSYVKLRGGAIASISKSLIIGLQDSLTYDVRVKVKAGGVWGNYGNTCTITINTALAIIADNSGNNNYDLQRSSETDSEEASAISNNDVKVVVYPNPSDNLGFNVNLTGLNDEANNIVVNVYDMYGKIVWTKAMNVEQGDQIVAVNNDGSLAKGIYLVNTQVNGNVLTQKIIIQ